MFKFIKKLFTKKIIEPEVTYTILLNEITTNCTKMYIEHDTEIAYLFGVKAKLCSYDNISFNYRNGVYKGEGVIGQCWYDPNTDRYDYQIKITKYNKTNRYNPSCKKCNVETIQTKTNITFKLTYGAYIIPNVECYKCKNCDELILGYKENAQLEHIVNEFNLKQKGA